MAVTLIHPGLSPHIFRGSHDIWYRGERYEALTAQGVSLMAAETPVVSQPPALSGGALRMTLGALVLDPPTISAGRPVPELRLISLTRGGVDVLNELEGDRIPLPLPGDYVAVWTASNGVLPNAGRIATRTVDAADVQDVQLSLTPVPDLTDDAPVGTVVAAIVTDADSLTLAGPDAARLDIDGTQVVTTSTLAGLSGLEIAVEGRRSGYRPVTRAATVDIARAWQVTGGANSVTIHRMPAVPPLGAGGGVNQTIITED